MFDRTRFRLRALFRPSALEGEFGNVGLHQEHARNEQGMTRWLIGVMLGAAA